MQLALNLVGGVDAGPLFAPERKRRPPKRDPRSTKAPGRLRRASERRATPSWADRKAIANVFKHARLLSKRTGITHSVDHIVPINHPLVCGLHVEANLRVIPMEENARKSNTYRPDMPEVQTELLLPSAALCYPDCYPR